MTACPTHALLRNHMHLLVCNPLKLRSTGRRLTQLGYKSLTTGHSRISKLHSNLPQNPTETQGIWPLPSSPLVCIAQERCLVTFIYRDHTPPVLDVTVLLKRWMKAHGNLEPQAVQFQSSFPSIRLHPIPHPRRVSCGAIRRTFTLTKAFWWFTTQRCLTQRSDEHQCQE